VGLRIDNLTQQAISLSSPLNGVLGSRSSRTFPHIEYDKTINDKRYDILLRNGQIKIVDLDATSVHYDSAWFGPDKFRLGTYHLWVDATNNLRMKTGGDATHDTDGVIIGPGGAPIPHGVTHVFTGVDPIPDIEVLETEWNCPATVAVRDVVYQTGASSVDKAKADSTSTMPAVGVVISKPTATTCIINRSGEIGGFAGALTADLYYYVDPSTAGAITNTPPNTSGNVVQQVGYAKTTSILVVQLGLPLKKA